MAFTVTVKSNRRCFLAGDTFNVSATIEAVGSDPVPQNVTYAWSHNDQPLQDTTKTITITNATSANAGNYKVTVTDTDTQEVVESNVFKMTEAELVVKLDKHSQYVPHDEQTGIVATVAYSTGQSPANNYTLNFKWEHNGVDLGNNTDTLIIPNFTDDKNGEYKVKVWGESEASMDSAAIDLVSIALSVVEDLPLEKTVVLGKELTLPYRVMGVTVGNVPASMPPLKVKQKWYLQREGQSAPTLIGSEEGEAIEGFVIMPNGYLHKDAATTDDTANFWCVAELYQTLNKNDVLIEDKGSSHCAVEVVESLHSMLRYVHPIPWRKTSFIYIGWWVFDEIVKFNEKGQDWRDRAVYEDSRYAHDIETIAAAEEKFGDCICMESRNGFMYNASELHRLDREILEKVLRIRETPPA